MGDVKMIMTILFIGGAVGIAIFCWKVIFPITDAVFCPYVQPYKRMKKKEKELIKMYGENYREVLNENLTKR